MSTGLIGAKGKREPEGGTVGSFLEAAGAAAPPLFEAKPAKAESTVYLVRHRETSLGEQHTGVTDIPLTANGLSVARRLQPTLAVNRRFS